MGSAPLRPPPCLSDFACLQGDGTLPGFFGLSGELGGETLSELGNAYNFVEHCLRLGG